MQLLTIVLYIDNDHLESMALACLLLTVIVYIFLEALSGPSLHVCSSTSPRSTYITYASNGIETPHELSTRHPTPRSPLKGTRALRAHNAHLPRSRAVG